MKKLLIFFDGSCNPNPGGVVGIGVDILEVEGFVLHNPDSAESKTSYTSSRRVHQISETIDPTDKEFLSCTTTNNVAEHLAMYKGMWWAMAKIFQHPDVYEGLVVFGDSQMAIKQMRNEFAINTHKEYYTMAKRNLHLIQEINSVRPVEFYWIPRELNVIADKLSK